MTAEFVGPATQAVPAARVSLGDALTPSKAVVLDWFEFLSTGRLAEAYKLMADDGHFWTLRQRTAVSSHRFAEIFTDTWRNTFTDGVVFTVGSVTAEDDRVAVVAEAHATIAEGARPYANMYHFLFTVRDGQIVDVCEFADTLRSAEAFAPPGSAS